MDEIHALAYARFGVIVCVFIYGGFALFGTGMQKRIALCLLAISSIMTAYLSPNPWGWAVPVLLFLVVPGMALLVLRGFQAITEPGRSTSVERDNKSRILTVREFLSALWK